MGAEQSSPANESYRILSSSLGNATSIEPPESSSLPPSPQHSSLQFSRGLSRESSKSVTMSNFNTVHDIVPPTPPLPSLGSTSELNSNNLSSHASLSHQSRQYSPSLSKLNRSSGIVVVCPGPMRRMRSTGSLDSATHSFGRVDVGSAELRRLRQIPTFEPLIPRSVGSLNNPPSGSPTSSASSSRHLDISLPRVAPDELIAFVKRYGEYVRHCASTASQRQTLVLGLQNKVDYETRRVWNALQARENGIVLTSPAPLSPSIASNLIPFESASSPPPHVSNKEIEVTYAGRPQVDAVVLQTSQVSGLIDQCSAMVERLRDTIAQLKNTAANETVSGKGSSTTSGD